MKFPSLLVALRVNWSWVTAYYAHAIFHKHFFPFDEFFMWISWTFFLVAAFLLLHEKIVNPRRVWKLASDESEGGKKATE